MKEISLTRGKVSIVDDEDFEYLNQWKWNYTGHYASRSVKGKVILMHRQIMNFPNKKEIDHINHNRLDNRKENLRECSSEENGRNKSKRSGTYSKFLGVTKSRKKWMAQIEKDGKSTYLGVFDSEYEAAKVYDKKAIEIFGEFASLNFPNIHIQKGE